MIRRLGFVSDASRAARTARPSSLGQASFDHEASFAHDDPKPWPPATGSRRRGEAPASVERTKDFPIRAQICVACEWGRQRQAASPAEPPSITTLRTRVHRQRAQAEDGWNTDQELRRRGALQALYPELSEGRIIIRLLDNQSSGAVGYFPYWASVGMHRVLGRPDRVAAPTRRAIKQAPRSS